METNNETVVPAHYNPNQLVTYKVIDLDATDQTISYPTVKVTEIEWDLEQARRKSKRLSEYSDKVGQLENRLPEYLDMDSEEIVSDICSIFGLNPTRDIEFEATATITGTVSIPLADLKDFDIDNLDLYVNVDSYAYDVSADAEVDNITTL
ncbi:MAG: hypothetical protein EBY78_05720 [Actinobacteria bacterium]|jgi:hypothetical protein|nr:hypothetical protein [Actinomycetota bacterium]